MHKIYISKLHVHIIKLNERKCIIVNYIYYINYKFIIINKIILNFYEL